MALVNGPLFSLGASGQVGKALVFAKWKGRDYVREYVVPANPRTMEQIFQRSSLGAYARWWNIFDFDLTIKPSWNGLAAEQNISGFNAFLGYNLKRRPLDQPPVGKLGGGTAALDGIATITASSPEPGRIVISGDLTGNQYDTDLQLFMLGTDGGANTTSADLRRCIGGYVPAYDATTFAWEVTGIEPGTYYVCGRSIGTSGNIAAANYTASAVVVA